MELKYWDKDTTDLKFIMGCDISQDKDMTIFSYVVMKKEDSVCIVVDQDIKMYRNKEYRSDDFKKDCQKICDLYNINYEDVSNKFSLKEGTFYIHKTK